MDNTKEPEAVCEVVDEKYNRVHFYRQTGDTSKPYHRPKEKLYDQACVDVLVAQRVEAKLVIEEQSQELYRSKFKIADLQAEVDSLNEQLYPFLKAKWERKQVELLAKLLYPAQASYSGKLYPKFYNPHCVLNRGAYYHDHDIDSVELRSQGLASLTVQWTCADYYEHHTQVIPFAWVDYDNQIEDIESAVAEWCEQEKIKLEEKKAENSAKAKAARLASLEAELKILKGE